MEKNRTSLVERSILKFLEEKGALEGIFNLFFLLTFLCINVFGFNSDINL